MPPVTQALIIANVVGFLLEIMLGGIVFELFALWTGGEGLAAIPWSAPWQLVTYSFLHGGLGHLAFNMFGLWMFGSELEALWGPRRYLACYASSVLAGAATQLLVAGAGSAAGPVIGASAGVFGLLLGFAVTFPERTVLLLFPPIPMRARTFALLYAIVELAFGLTGIQSGVAHFAHLGGMLGAWLCIRRTRGRFPFRRI